MGIQGLLPTLRSITEKVHISQFKGKRIAVDGYVWLHRASFCCSKELVLGEPTTKWLTYFINRLNLLRENGIEVFLVFDGANLPAKKETNKARAVNRQAYRQKGLRLLKEGDAKGANEAFQKAVDVTPKMAGEIIREIKHNYSDVKYVVAPYEADAQLAWLFKHNYVDLILTEDSDLLAYGCKKVRKEKLMEVIFKMEKSGDCDFIDLERLHEINEYKNFTEEMFRWTCILSGCDYVDSIPGLGIKTAQSIVKTTKDIKRIMRALRIERGLQMPLDYIEKFGNANLTFLHHKVFDIEKEKIVHLHPLEEGMDARFFEFLGPDVEEEIARRIANGSIDPDTLQDFEFPPMEIKRANTMVELGKSEKHTIHPKRGSISFVQKNLISSYLVATNSSATKLPYKAPKSKKNGPLDKFLTPKNKTEELDTSAKPLYEEKQISSELEKRPIPSSQIITVSTPPEIHSPKGSLPSSIGSNDNKILCNSTPSPSILNGNATPIAPESPHCKEQKMTIRRKVCVDIYSKHFREKTESNSTPGKEILAEHTQRISPAFIANIRKKRTRSRENPNIVEKKIKTQVVDENTVNEAVTFTVTEHNEMEEENVETDSTQNNEDSAKTFSRMLEGSCFVSSNRITTLPQTVDRSKPRINFKTLLTGSSYASTIQ